MDKTIRKINALFTIFIIPAPLPIILIQISFFLGGDSAFTPNPLLGMIDCILSLITAFYSAVISLGALFIA
jgi:hypothetical protein